MKFNKITAALLLIIALVFSTGCSSGSDSDGEVKNALDSLPKNVQESFVDYESNNWEGKSDKTPGTKDNSEFQNRDGDLPEEDSEGREIRYREHDVNNKEQHQGRDAERFVSGSDGSVYYTGDHYETFIKLK